MQPFHEKPGPRTPEGRARIAAATAARWAELRQSGDQTRLGELSAEGLEALRAARLGKKACAETREKIRKAAKRRELAKLFARVMDPYRFRVGGRQWI